LLRALTVAGFLMLVTPAAARVRARVTIVAHDAGKKPKHKRTTARIALAYVR
jgi:hypothetical protein